MDARFQHALRHIDIGIGYAVWAGIGAVGAALLGPVFFDETFTWAKAWWRSSPV